MDHISIMGHRLRTEAGMDVTVATAALRLLVEAVGMKKESV